MDHVWIVLSFDWDGDDDEGHFVIDSVWKDEAQAQEQAKHVFMGEVRRYKIN